jgi:hypothetical protein
MIGCRAAGLTLGLVLLASSLGAATADAQRQEIRGIYADEARTRRRAAERLIALGQSSVPLVDPFESGCIRASAFPPHCRNFDRALTATVQILDAVATRGADTANAAKDLLWRMLHSPAGDVFGELEQRDEWERTDADALRRRARTAVERLMAIRANLGEREVARRATARAADGGRRWYLLRNCAGGSMYAACQYGSYLFGGDSRRPSFRLIRHDDSDNFGAGVTVGLSFVGPQRAVGLARAEGGFGGDLTALTFYRLGATQAPLCTLVATEGVRRLLDDWQRYVTIRADDCQAAARDARIRFTTYR